jgi:DNA-binding response OmpR family regulator
MLILLVGLDARAVDSLRPRLVAVAPSADVTVVQECQEAEAEFFADRPDVVVIDIGALGTRGWALARTLRRQWDGALIALGNGKPSTESFRTRCDAYVAKPFVPRHLAEVIALLVPHR